MTATPSLKQEIGNISGTSDIYGVYWCANVVTPTYDYICHSIKFYSQRGSVSPNMLTVSIKLADVNHKPTGLDLAIGTVDGGTWGYPELIDHEITLTSPIILESGTEYAIVMRAPSASYNGRVQMRKLIAAGIISSNDSGATWTASGYGPQGINFETWGCIPCTVSTVNAINIGSTTAILQGALDSLGDYTPVYCSFEYGTDITYGSSTSEQEFTSASAFSASISGLTSGETYHFRARGRYI